MNDINFHYKILGIEPGATEEEIKQTYIDLVMVWNPDRFENDPHLRQKVEEKLKEIINAYNTIKSSFKDFDRCTEPQKARQSHSYQQSPSSQQSMIVPEMVYISGGEFIMGSNNGDDDEKPVHRVKVDAFYIGKYEVTQREWISVMGSNPSNFKGDDLPVEQVSRNDIQEYLQKLSQITGKRWRLPTEAEWEYACRAGSTTKYCFGDNETHLCEYAWYNNNSGNKTHPVGQKKPNAWGLYDMHGNVYEWCYNWYDENYYANSPLTNPMGPESGGYRLIRGGGWHDGTSYLRSADRYSYYDPTDRYSDLGFRCLQEP